jgi:hypothetical protein
MRKEVLNPPKSPLSGGQNRIPSLISETRRDGDPHGRRSVGREGQGGLVLSLAEGFYR